MLVDRLLNVTDKIRKVVDSSLIVTDKAIKVEDTFYSGG